MSIKSKKDPIMGCLLYRFFWLIGKLPSWWHYCCADLLSYLVQHVIKYRRDVVRMNLRNSFPELSEKELKRLEHKVYVNICDLAVEIIMLCGFTEKRLRRHLTLHHGELFEQLHAEGHTNIYMFLGHYGNWEWYTALQDYLPATEFNVLYREQHGAWNYLMERVRSKFGAKILNKDTAPKTILKRRHETTPRSYIFVADQVPGLNSIHLFVNFFHQLTPTFTGMERLARMASAPVIYVDVDKPRRGKYDVTLELMTKDASAYKEGELATQFMNRLEKTIRKAPECWLWSHRRWKHTLEDVKRLYPDKEITIL